MKKEFGATKNGEKASCYVLKNSKGMEAVVSDFGASLLKLYVPDKDGKTQDVVLGYETLEDYENGGDSLGATVGRVANRIGMAEFELNGICTCKSGWGSGIPGRSENRGILYNHRRK